MNAEEGMVDYVSRRFRIVGVSRHWGVYLADVLIGRVDEDPDKQFTCHARQNGRWYRIPFDGTTQDAAEYAILQHHFDIKA
jgi:hypothetical protein